MSSLVTSGMNVIASSNTAKARWGFWVLDAPESAIWRQALTLAVALLFLNGQRLQAQAIDFNRDVLPILTENCFACHGPDEGAREAGLRLDDRQVLIDMDVIVPGRPKESSLVERIQSDDPDLVMPPVGSRKRLTQSQKKVLVEWIRQGAPYETHWSYRPIVRPVSPNGRPDFAVHNEIDAFVVDALEKNQLSQNGEADRLTLLRRVYLDLVGIPPTPEEQRAFCEDTSPLSYEHVVDRLLDSQMFGERFAPMWLDVVRYADTVGYHGDQNQNAFAYRDWVIDALNANMRFDQFTIEQLAGDLLPEPTESQHIATCFNRLNMMTREGGAQPDEYLAKYAADRVRTVGMAWLGSTVGCAECHDHKYDPFTMSDFYSVAAYFADIKQWGVYQDYEYTPNPDLKNWSNDHPFPPERVVEVPYLKRRRQQLIDTREALVQSTFSVEMESSQARDVYAGWSQRMREYLFDTGGAWAWMTPVAIVGEGLAKAKQIIDESPSERSNADESWSSRSGAWLHILDGQPGKLQVMINVDPLPNKIPWAALRIDFTPIGEHLFPPKHNSAILRVGVERQSSDGTSRIPVRIHFADASHRLPRYYNGFEILGIQSGWEIPNSDSRVQSVWVFEEPLALDVGEHLIVTINGIPTARLACAISPWSPNVVNREKTFIDDDSVAALMRSAGGTDGAEGSWSEPAPTAIIRQWLMNGLQQGQSAVRNELRRLEREILECREGTWPVMVTEAQAPHTTRVLQRGNWQDQSGPEVWPAPPSFLPGWSAVSGARETRLDLARWLVSDENPLTARVQVNRLWAHFFGRGLSAVLDDFGRQGAYPTHPELLDWLASEYRDSGWDTKHIVRLIVTSATYRQSSTPSAPAREFDPSNRWLSHQNIRRLEAEVIRDNALAIAGILNRDMGGPPVFPYQPDNYYAHLQFPDRRYRAHTDDRQYRRSVYMHWQRTFLHPMLANFEAPSREECVGMRAEANTPQQALNLLNDPTFVEAAKGLALIIANEPDDAAAVRAAFARALCRSPTVQELDQLLVFVRSQREHWRGNAASAAQFIATGLLSTPDHIDPIELASWMATARVIMNLHETITRY